MIETGAKRVVIVGAGPAGLAVAACLRGLGVRARLLESGAAPGSSWLRRYDSLRLHTTRGDSRLPRLAMSRKGERYPTAREYAAYCAGYARAFALDLRLDVEARGVHRQGAGWRVDTSRGDEPAAVVVLATGRQYAPARPHIEGEESFAGELLHSADYRSGARFRDRRVLVVGGGNTAMDLLVDLDAHGARPMLAVRGPLHWMARDLGPLSWHWRLRAAVLAPLAVSRRLPRPLAVRLARLTAGAAAARARRRFGDLAALGLPLVSGAEILERMAIDRSPTVDHGALALLRRRAVPVFGELIALRFTTARCSKGPAGSPTEFDVDAVILATGYRADPRPLLFDPTGPAGAAGEEQGVFIAGKTPLLSAIRREARGLARRIVEALPR